MLESLSAFWAEYGDLLLEGTRDTLIMIGVSTVFAYLIGLPLGVLLSISQPHGIWPHKWFNRILGWITNEGRALLLLQDLGLLTLNEDAGLEATPNDIADNPHNLQFQEMDAAMLPQTIEEVDFSIINSNYALDAGLNPTTDALATEDAQSDAAQAYANIIAVKEGNENNEAIKALVAALQSDEIREFIETTYNGSVVPMF